ncbi:hypothetical protein L6164_024879 [Bauhinia variegata]|uniref:Uncharacterized protein n=1 Tax=Bauhinia variegata TaxID=167791 RepID=A0ACB9LZ61_BAUVA|nr:hypothetical protein L6164_024879 [Bauhinia variegata]
MHSTGYLHAMGGKMNHESMIFGHAVVMGPSRIKEKREKERNELRHLVGKNLNVLSQMEGMDLEMYKDTVLPKVLEQVFPDEYHLQTLETLLGASPQLQPTVDIKTVLSQLMERLSNYAASSKFVLPEFLQVEAFAKLSNAISRARRSKQRIKKESPFFVHTDNSFYQLQVIEAQVDMPIVGAIGLHVSLLTFTLRVHPDRLDYVDQVLGACVKKIPGKPKLDDNRATKPIVALLSAPLDKYNDVITALILSNYPLVMDRLNNETNKLMAMVIIQSIMKNNTCISTADKDLSRIWMEQLWMRLMKKISMRTKLCCSPYTHASKWGTRGNVKDHMHCEEAYHSGGPRRLPFTVPALIFSALRLVRRLQGQDGDVVGGEVPTTPQTIFQLLNEKNEALFSLPSPELALRLYLQCAEDSKAQVTAIHLIIGTLQKMNGFGVENRDTLTHKATGYSAKIFKKPDQCRAVYACSHLFWVDDPEGIKDGERVSLCLKRALRMANVTRGSSGPVTLFVEILNESKGGLLGEKYDSIKV